VRRNIPLLVLVLATTAAIFAGVERGNRHYRAGEYVEAVAAYRSALGTRADGPVLQYNLGTALLRLGRYEEAEEHLRRALETVEPETRGRVHYNLGLRYLEEARANPDPAAAAALYDAAVEAYRQALRLAPQDGEAKWNYELALRERDEHDSPDAGGQDEDQDQDQEQQEGDDGTGAGSPGQADRARTGGPATEHAPMSREEAERILAAIEQDERDLLQDRLRQGRQERPERDW
jgi:Ca-activated chloride channel homolog